MKKIAAIVVAALALGVLGAVPAEAATKCKKWPADGRLHPAVCLIKKGKPRPVRGEFAPISASEFSRLLAHRSA